MSESGADSVCRPFAQPPQHPLQELRALLLVRVGSGYDEGFAYPGNTLAFASRDRFNIFLKVRADSESQPAVFLHRGNLSTPTIRKSA